MRIFTLTSVLKSLPTNPLSKLLLISIVTTSPELDLGIEISIEHVILGPVLLVIMRRVSYLIYLEIYLGIEILGLVSPAITTRLYFRSRSTRARIKILGLLLTGRLLILIL